MVLLLNERKRADFIDEKGIEDLLEKGKNRHRKHERSTSTDNDSIDRTVDVTPPSRNQQGHHAVPSQVRSDVPDKEKDDTENAEFQQYGDVAEADRHPPERPVRVCNAGQNPCKDRIPRHTTRHRQVDLKVLDILEHPIGKPEKKSAARQTKNSDRLGMSDDIGKPQHEERKQGYFQKTVTKDDQRSGEKPPSEAFADRHGQDRAGHDSTRQGYHE